MGGEVEPWGHHAHTHEIHQQTSQPVNKIGADNMLTSCLIITEHADTQTRGVHTGTRSATLHERSTALSRALVVHQKVVCDVVELAVDMEPLDRP